MSFGPAAGTISELGDAARAPFLMNVPYIPHTPEDSAEMLKAIGADSIDSLFKEIPANLKIKDGSLNIPPAMDEQELMTTLTELSNRNTHAFQAKCFLGAGIYDRFIPSTIPALLSRGEFLTAYTPYQPEVSQGYLQAIYEFQSMIAELYGVPIANASMYDGATSLAEAAILAHSVNGRTGIYVSEAVHPHYRQVLETYCWSMSLTVHSLPVHNGRTSLGKVGEDAACVLIQSPNFFGIIEDLGEAHDVAKANGALFIVSSDPVSNALLKPPGEFGADIVVGEGQPLGVPMGLGGPVVGLFGCREEFVRRLPGRIVGRTKDHEGRSGFVMTLRTREQDIRREKATSNICTNEALMALANTIYLGAMGRNGLRQVAETSVRNTQYAISKLTEAGGKKKFDGKVFCEFVLELPVHDAEPVRDKLLGKGIMAGLPLGPYYSDLKNCLLVAVTETRTKKDIDAYATALKEVL